MRDKVVLITGPARGIGEAVARRAVQEGARVALVGMEPERLATLAAALGDAAAWWQADVTDQNALNAAVAGTIASFGRIDIVITNAGVANIGTVASADVEAMARVINVNVLGTIRTVKAALPHLIATRGYVLIVSSAAAFSPMPGMSAYATSKAAVEQFANVLRLEMVPHGVDVGSAHMLWIDTDLVRDVQNDLTSFRKTLARLPYPFNTETSLEDCTAAFVQACDTRARRVNVPRVLGVFSALRQLLNSAFAQRLLMPRMAAMLSESEAEMVQVGRAFGEHSVGMGDVEAREAASTVHD